MTKPIYELLAVVRLGTDPLYVLCPRELDKSSYPANTCPLPLPATILVPDRLATGRAVSHLPLGGLTAPLSDNRALFVTTVPPISDPDFSFLYGINRQLEEDFERCLKGARSEIGA